MHDSPIVRSVEDVEVNGIVQHRTCLLVLGMHRSGTSALTRVLNLLGAGLPRKLLGPGEGNELGHWESTAIIEFNDAMLKELGSNWYDWRPLSLSYLKPQRLDELRTEASDIIEREFGDQNLIVLKEPRMCRLSEFYFKVLEDLDFDIRPILIVRKPLEVTSSLEKRDGFAESHSGLLWLRHVLDSESATRERRRAIITYDDLLNDWRGTLEIITAQLAISWPQNISEVGDEIDAFLSPDHRHSKRDLHEASLGYAWRAWGIDVYQALLTLVHNPNSVAAIDELDWLKSKFDGNAPVFLDLLSTRDDKIDELLKGSAAREAEFARIVAEREQAVAERDAARAEIEALYRSTSWKVTAPFRKLQRIRHKVPGYINATRILAKESGGTGKAAMEFGRTWLQDGPRGISKRLRQSAINLNAKRLLAERAKNFTPLVSVIVPNFNHEKYLKDRLNSIYAQTYKNIEVILLDDCSTDASQQILERYAQYYPDQTRLIVNKTNSGSGYRQWSKGLKLANGKLIWIAESDDWCKSDFLQSLVPHFVYEDVRLAYVNSAFMNSTGSDKLWSTDKYLSDLDGDLWRTQFKMTAHQLVGKGFAIKNVVPNVSGAIFANPGPQSDIIDALWSRKKICGDWLFYLHLIRGGSIAYSPQQKNYYRVHDRSTAKSTFYKDVYYEEHEDIAQFVLENFEVSDGFIDSQNENLRVHWEHHRADYTSEKFSSCYDPEKIKARSSRKKPNILMVAYAFASGGGETFPIFLANMLKARGFSVTFCSYEQETREDGVRQLLRPDIPVLINFENLGQVVEDFAIDIIHSHHAWVDRAVVDSLGEPSRAKTVATMHGMYESMDLSVQNQFVTEMTERLDAIIYTAEKNLGPFKRLGLANNPKIVNITNALEEVDIIPVARSSLEISNDAFVLCLVSRGIPEKGWEEGIEAVSIARENSGLDIRLIIIGEGPEFNRLRTMGDEYNHVRFLGFKRNIRDYYAMADLGFLPSRFSGESYPLTLIDCLSSGTPILASNVGEIKNMLEAGGGKTAGRTFDLNEGRLPIKEIAELIATLAQREGDYDEIAAGVAKAYDKFKPEKMLDKYIEVYQKLYSEGRLNRGSGASSRTPKEVRIHQ